MQCTVVRVTFRDPNGYHVLSVKDKSGRLTKAVGTLAMEGNIEGLTFTFSGAWEIHHVHGKQFVFHAYRLEDNELFYFLSKVVKGLGPGTAKKVIDTFGEDELIRILDDDPDRLTAIKGIKGKKIQKIKESWGKHRELRALSDYLAPHGITTNTIVRIFNHFGQNAVEHIRKNPYVLTEIHGMGFKTADRVAVQLGVKPDSMFRIRKCIEYVMINEAENKGNTALAAGEIVRMTKEELDGESPGAEVSHETVAGYAKEMFREGELLGAGPLVALRSYYTIEKKILDLIDLRTSAEPIPLMTRSETDDFIAAKELERGITLSDEQRTAIHLVAEGHSSILLCGFAGTGKTTVSRLLLDLLSNRYGDSQIACMALSGIAADRIRSVTGYHAATIHTTLKFDGKSFRHKKGNPLPYKVLLLDESSMVNTSLYLKILEAVDNDAVFISVGDTGQLPPIGAGDPFSNLVESGRVPTVKLNRIYRQSSDSVLVEFANNIRQGVIPRSYDYQGYRDFLFIDRSIPGYRNLKTTLPEKELKALKDRNNEEIVEILLDQVAAALPYIQNSVTDFQVLSPQRKGVAGTDNLNKRLQGVCNPGETEKKVERFGFTFKKLDKVVHLRNKDMNVMSEADYKTYGFESGHTSTERIYNGNVGIVAEVDVENEYLFVLYPFADGGIVVRYDFMQVGDILELAYAMSIHKSQGNEMAYVFMPLTSAHFNMLNSKLLYTAVTRGKSKTVVVGQSSTFAMTCKNLDKSRRETVMSILMSRKS